MFVYDPFTVDAKPYLSEIARCFNECGLDAIMIGNAAAAINGAPVTTLDVDFMIEQTDHNFRKLAAIAQRMKCQLMEMKLRDGNYMYRIAHASEPLIVDVLFAPAGIKDFDELARNASTVMFDGNALRVASLADVLRSKKAAGREKDTATIPLLEKTLVEKSRQT